MRTTPAAVTAKRAFGLVTVAGTCRSKPLGRSRWPRRSRCRQRSATWERLSRRRAASGRSRTCPPGRGGYAVGAPAAASAAVMLPGRFSLGAGSGVALNEHILGGRWPSGGVRREMLEEAVEVVRLLWQGGSQSHFGRHYTVEQAALFTLPGAPPPIVVSGFGQHSIDLAARIGDGYFTTAPDADAVER